MRAVRVVDEHLTVSSSRLRRVSFAQADSAAQSPQRSRRPPVARAEQPHQRRHEQGAHDRRVDQDRERRANAELFDEDDRRHREGADGDAEQQCCGGDDPAGALESDRDGLLASYAEVVPEALDGLSGEERMRVYEMLQLEVKPDTEGYEVSGAFCSKRPRGRRR